MSGKYTIRRSLGMRLALFFTALLLLQTEKRWRRLFQREHKFIESQPSQEAAARPHRKLLKTDYSPYLAGGNSAPRGRFEYMASLRTPRHRLHGCGAVLIAPGWILTAAHCVHPGLDYSVGPNPIVHIGLYSIDSDEAVRGVEVMATVNTYIHPDFDGDVANSADIALLQLEKPSKKKHARIASPILELRHGDVMVALGWGRSGPNGPLAASLQQAADLPFIPTRNCNFKDVWDGLIKPGMLCAGGVKMDTCHGDSGGPLLITDQPGGVLEYGNPRFDVLVGITSFGHKDCLKFGQPGIFTNVSYYAPWITSVMANPAQAAPVGRLEVKAARYLQGGVPRHSKRANPDGPESKYSPKNGTISAVTKTESIVCSQLQNDDENFQIENTLFDAAEKGNVTQVNLLLADKNNEDEINRFTLGLAPLHVAAEKGFTPIVEILIKAGALVNLAAQSTNEFPLHKSVMQNNTGITRRLLAAGAHVNVRDSKGRIPLHYAAMEGNLQLIQMLLDSGSVFDLRDVSGMTALHYAAWYGFADVIEAMKSAGGRTHLRNNDGRVPGEMICRCEPQTCSTLCSTHRERMKRLLT